MPAGSPRESPQRAIFMHLNAYQGAVKVYICGMDKFNHRFHRGPYFSGKKEKSFLYRYDKWIPAHEAAGHPNPEPRP